MLYLLVFLGYFILAFSKQNINVCKYISWMAIIFYIKILLKYLELQTKSKIQLMTTYFCLFFKSLPCILIFVAKVYVKLFSEFEWCITLLPENKKKKVFFFRKAKKFPSIPAFLWCYKRTSWPYTLACLFRN